MLLFFGTGIDSVCLWGRRRIFTFMPVITIVSLLILLKFFRLHTLFQYHTFIYFGHQFLFNIIWGAVMMIFTISMGLFACHPYEPSQLLDTLLPFINHSQIYLFDESFSCTLSWVPTSRELEPTWVLSAMIRLRSVRNFEVNLLGYFLHQQGLAEWYPRILFLFSFGRFIFLYDNSIIII